MAQERLWRSDSLLLISAMPTRRRPKKNIPTPQVGTNRVAIGQIVGTRGSWGHLKVQPLGPSASFLSIGYGLFVGINSHNIESCQQSGDRLIMKLTEIDSAEAAKALLGQYLEVDEEKLPVLNDGNYYHFQLIGLSVQTVDGQDLGHVTDIIATGSNDVYVVTGALGDILIPAIAEVLKELDLTHRTLIIEPLPGLIPRQTKGD